MTNTGTSLVETNISGIKVVPLGDIHPTSSTSAKKVGLKILNTNRDIKYTIHLSTLYLKPVINYLVPKDSVQGKCILFIMEE